VPEGKQHLDAAHTSSGSHAAFTVHASPAEAKHVSPQKPFANVFPEQHWVAATGVLPGPRQVHTPPVQKPDVQSFGAAHAAAFASVAWQVPAWQKPEAHASSPAQGVPSGCFAAQAPLLQKPDMHSASVVHALPFGCTPQVPSRHIPERHIEAPLQLWPSVRPHMPR
jgi:hypothetical protein